jgi:predicted translin family RNA/ssDNA-binding protein
METAGLANFLKAEVLMPFEEANRQLDQARELVRNLADKLEDTTRLLVASMQENAELKRQLADLRSCFPLMPGGGR